jgi:hypothetical protein
MECPDCGLPVLIEHGTIQPHLQPDTLKQCDARAPKATASHKGDDADAPAEPTAKKEAAKKAPSRAASKTKPHKS